jgi:hypothetical protein
MYIRATSGGWIVQRTARVLLAAALAVAAGSQVWAANLFGGNGVYRVVVSDGAQFWKCGVWTASTGTSHPAGPGLPLLGAANSQFPLDSSFTTLRSYLTDRSYTTNDLCTPLCIFAGSPSVRPIARGGVTVGYRLSWIFRDTPSSPGLGGPQIRFTQEVAVEGPVDGTETVDNSFVRETHIVENLGPGGFRFGLRKLWDLLVGDDWGPWLGDCDSPEAACDRSLEFRRFGIPSYPRNFLVNADPAVAACPGGIEPNEPAGCGGNPPYVVAFSVQPPTAQFPRPNPPELVQFNNWNIAFSCWQSDLLDAAACGAGGFSDDMALLYYWGLTLDTAVRLPAGGSRSYTQYIAAGVETCPFPLTAERPLDRPGR